MIQTHGFFFLLVHSTFFFSRSCHALLCLCSFHHIYSLLIHSLIPVSILAFIDFLIPHLFHIYCFPSSDGTKFADMISALKILKVRSEYHHTPSCLSNLFLHHSCSQSDFCNIFATLSSSSGFCTFFIPSTSLTLNSHAWKCLPILSSQSKILPPL